MSPELLVMELVEPSTEYKDSFIEAVREFQADADDSSRNQWYRRLSIPELQRGFEAFADTEKSHLRGENLSEEYVPYTEYWLVDDCEFIGRASVFHRLEGRRKITGHIGFDIRPSKRGKGYGNEILRLALQKAKDFGLKRVLLSHDVRNTASRKIIEKNGGVFENQVSIDEKGSEGSVGLRYRIIIE